MVKTAAHVARRFLASSLTPDQRHTQLIAEIDELEELQKEIEDFIFLEEPAIHLLAKMKRLFQKHLDLKDAMRDLESGMDDFHDHVLRELSSAVEEVDEALSRRQDELDEVSDQLRSR